MANHEIDVAELIDGNDISVFQVSVVMLCFLILALDGFDTAAISYIAPVVRSSWHLQPYQFAPVFGAGLIGLMVGALLIGSAADKLGRKRILLFSVLCFGVASLVTAWAASMHELVILRFLTGVGLGGAMPNAITLTSEYCPASRRSLLVTTMFCGFTVGSAVGGFAAAALIDLYGWRSVLIAGGIAPLFLLPLLAWRLPESVRYLVEIGGRPRDVSALLLRIAPKADLRSVRFVIAKREQSGSPVNRLFQDGLAGGTVLLWVTFFMSLLVIYLLSSWLPSLLRAGGASLRTAAVVGAMFQVGGTVGAIVLGWLMDRFDPHRVLSVAYAFAGLSTAAIGSLTASPVLAGIAVFVAGFFVSGSQIGGNVLSASFYPTGCRATGVSWANGFGRLGSVVGAVGGGALVAVNLSMPDLFVVVGLPAIVACLSMFALGHHRARIAVSPVELELPTTKHPK